MVKVNPDATLGRSLMLCIFDRSWQHNGRDHFCFCNEVL